MTDPSSRVGPGTPARLAGRRALVTGAARGIGLACAIRFRDEGAHVVGVDASVPADTRRLPGIEWLEGDVADLDLMRQAAGAASRDGALDICLANAGIGGIESFADGDVAAWERVLRVNLLGVMITLLAAAEPMIREGREGRLLVTGSIAGIHGEAEAPAYAASKGGVMSLVRSLAVELAPHRITVNAVAPGQIDTDLNARDVDAVSQRSGSGADEFRARFLAEHVPAGRMGTPDEVAALFAFLASPEAAYITGTTLRIDGGELAI